LADLTALHVVVQRAYAAGVRVILQPLDTGLYFNELADVPTSPGHYADFLSRMARAWRRWPNVVISLGRDPSFHSSAEWFKTALNCMRAIVDVNDQQTILVPLQGSTLPPNEWYEHRHEKVIFDRELSLNTLTTEGVVVCGAFDPQPVQAYLGWLRANGFKGLLHTGYVDAPSCLIPFTQLQDFQDRYNDTLVGITTGHRFLTQLNQVI
jgi:hypothetical protein